MKSFLGNVAESLWSHYGGDISSLRLLVPNARSRLFFADELAAIVDRPVWEPSYVTIDEIMYGMAGVGQADRIKSVVELYKVYSRYHREDFDSFYFWGETLLGDFDQIDKYMVDAGRLFSNLNDLKELEDSFAYLNEEQREVVRRFWASFGDEEGRSDEKRDFLRIWNTLARIYCGFRESLAETGVAYTGMAHRMAAEAILAGETPEDGNAHYAVIGFNALTECEKVLFDSLKKSGRADFFWDYDDYYLRDAEQEAGLFMRANVIRYPQPYYFLNATDNFSKSKNITAVSVASDSLQCKYAASFLGRTAGEQGSVGKETAIVLTNEDLLVPLLHSIPEDVKDVNVTMGYPLRQTLAYSFVERLFKLQAHVRRRCGAAEFYHADATGLLTHPFVVESDAGNAAGINSDILSKSRVYAPEKLFRTGTLVEKIFTGVEEWAGIIPYVIGILSSVASSEARSAADREYLGVTADTLRRLDNSLADCGLELTVPVLSSLARRMLQNVRIPFSGEPLSGLQVMGILETRNLDFRNVMVMSMNDDTFPGNLSAGSSFIPHNLRVAYGLPTPRHHEGVYAYYFYRLLQRAENVDMVYCSRNDVNTSGEKSRYIYQLEYESGHGVRHVRAGVDVSLPYAEPITVQKTPGIMSELEKFLDGGERSLSPSAFNAYVDCGLKFYFRSVAGLKPGDTVSEEVDLPMFGTILHKAMELLYRPFVGSDDPRDNIKALIRSEAVAKAVDDAIAGEYFHGESIPAGEYEGNLLMVRDIVIKYIDGSILPFDSGGERFAIVDLEKKMNASFGFMPKGGKRTVRFYGLADRIDLMGDGRLRIVDYKTGSPRADFGGVAALFSDAPGERSAAVLQTLIYSLMADRMQAGGELPGRGSLPALYYVREMNREGYSPLLNNNKVPVTGYGEVKEELEGFLADRLSEIFDPAVPFVQCADPKPCGYCDFDAICRRGEKSR